MSFFSKFSLAVVFSKTSSKIIVAVQFIISIWEFSLVVSISPYFVPVSHLNSASAFLSDGLQKGKFVRLVIIWFSPFLSTTVHMNILSTPGTGCHWRRRLVYGLYFICINNSWVLTLAYMAHVVFLGTIQVHFTSPKGLERADSFPFIFCHSPPCLVTFLGTVLRLN